MIRRSTTNRAYVMRWSVVSNDCHRREQCFFDPLGLASPSRSNLVAREPLQRFHASWGNAAASLTTLACASIPKMNLTPRPSHRSNSPVNVKSVSPPSENARHAAGERNSPSDHNGWVKRILLIGFHPLQGKWCKELDVDQMRHISTRKATWRQTHRTGPGPKGGAHGFIRQTSRPR